MTNPFQLTFTLKQHTPIIHFQHQQVGATLRATEVKPKLDKFIIQKMKAEKKSVPDSWYNNKERGSLDYKIRILNSKKEEKTVRLEFETTFDRQTQSNKYKVNRNSAYPMMLANMVAKNSKEELKDLRQFEEIDCSIICLNTELKMILEESLSSFFALHNFGNRNNKGFGSFSVSKLNDINITWNETLLPLNTIFLNIPSNDKKTIFDVIDYFYKWLKSGVNYSYDSYNNKCNTGRYKKAVLFEYLESLYPISPALGENWEKKWMKEKYLSLPVYTPIKYNSKYYRALLGLSDKHTFTKAQCNSDKEFVSTFQSGLNYKIELQNAHTNKEIDRIESPYIFKIININANQTKVYILINSVHIDKIYATPINKSFTFYKSNEINLSYRIGNNDFNVTFKYPKDDLNELDIHLNRLRPHIGIPALQNKFEQLEKFKNDFNSIELPNSAINFYDLIDFFMNKYPNFRAKDFRWRDIVNSDIQLKKI